MSSPTRQWVEESLDQEEGSLTHWSTWEVAMIEANSQARATGERHRVYLSIGGEWCVRPTFGAARSVRSDA